MDLFNEAAATHAAAYLLRKAGGRMPASSLLSLMYLADRAALSQRRRHVTGSSFTGTAAGPVPAQVQDLALGSEVGSLWRRHLGAEGSNLVLLADTDDGDLTPAACKILDSLHGELGTLSPADLTQHLRQRCPEWSREDPLAPISLESVLRACGRSKEQVRDFVEDFDDSIRFRRFLGGC